MGAAAEPAAQDPVPELQAGLPTLGKQPQFRFHRVEGVRDSGQAALDGQKGVIRPVSLNVVRQPQPGQILLAQQRLHFPGQRPREDQDHGQKIAIDRLAGCFALTASNAQQFVCQGIQDPLMLPADQHTGKDVVSRPG